MAASTASVHRYLQRTRTLLKKCAELLHARDAQVDLRVLGVMHVGHLFPGQVSSLAGADLVSLELPTTPVKALLSDIPEQRNAVHLRNIFWLDLLEHLRITPPRFGVCGTNVNPHVRYLRTRLYYQNGSMANDFSAPPAVVEHPFDRVYRSAELGGAGEERWNSTEIISALAEADQITFQRNRIVHIGPDRNPFGPARHLVVHQAPPPELLAVAEAAEQILWPAAVELRMPPAQLRKFVLRQLLEGFLIASNDFYLIEALLTAVLRAIPNLETGETLHVTHVAGIAHLPYLTRYLQLERSERLLLRTELDPRFPLHDAYMTPPFFARELEGVLAAMSLRGQELQVDLSASVALLERYVGEAREDSRRRLVLDSIWMRERAEQDGAFQTAAKETPLKPSPDYIQEYSAQLNRLITQHVTAELDLHTLEELNARLTDGGRRGDLAAIGQELYNLGWTFERLSADPAVGPHMERLAAVWSSEITPERAVEIIRAASTLLIA